MKDINYNQSGNIISQQNKIFASKISWRKSIAKLPIKQKLLILEELMMFVKVMRKRKEKLKRTL